MAWQVREASRRAGIERVRTMLARYRQLAVPLAVAAAVVLFYLVNPWFFPAAGSTERGVASVAFWVLMIAALVLLFEDRNTPETQPLEIQGPAFTRYLFSNPRAGLVWLPIRLFVGFEWLVAGWDKLTGKGWVDGGASLLGFWKNAVAVPTTGHAAITFEWYRSFLQVLIDNGAQSWFAWLITLGEIAVGLGLLLGALTGVAAFFGATMNMSFQLAGSASVNPIMFAFAVGLMLAWRVAGYYGLDRYLLPRLGVPWGSRPGRAPTMGSPVTTG